MAELTPVSPVEAAEPPKVNPLAQAGVTPPIVKPSPIHKPVLGATQTGLKPGVKLPPKPEGATAGLKPGLKLPTSPLKPGLKVPGKPMIHKPGATVMAKPLPKPVTPAGAPNAGTLPTVEAKPIAKDAATVPPTPAEKPMEALKSVTQKLKGITQQIPQQAILRKTGIIADAAMSDAQKQAAKSKTARISLSDAMGVAPVQNENAPMKTIRIKRPVNIPSATPAAVPSAGGNAAAEVPMEQRKTLKISRPSGGMVRPTGKFGVKHPVAAQVAESAPAGDTIADIPDVPTMPVMPMGNVAAQVEGPAWWWTVLVLVQFIALVAMGALAYFLFQNTTTQYF